MSSEDKEDKTEDPTEKRRQEASEKGQIIRSKDWNTLVLLLTAGLCMRSMHQGITNTLAGILKQSLLFSRADFFSDTFILQYLAKQSLSAFWGISQFMGIVLGSLLIGSFLVGGFHFSMHLLAPDFNRLNFFTGLAKVFSFKSIIELGKSLLKLAVVMGSFVLLVRTHFAKTLNLPRIETNYAMQLGVELMCQIFLMLSFSLILVACFDVPWQIWEYIKQLKMTKQEVRDEYKETQGSPELKAKIKRTQREMSKLRMIDKVSEANVILTNPTHFAVALKYEPGMAAPILVAKGVDHMAELIRKIALGKQIVIVPMPPLARALYYNCEMDHEIPRGLYMAVAKILAYVFELKLFRQGQAKKPTLPKDLPIPDEFSTRESM